LVLVTPLLTGALWYGAFRNGNGDSSSGKPVMAHAPFLPSWLAEAPFLADPTRWYFPLVQQLSQCVHRIFPFARGIFEDKVANVWCVLNVFVKLRAYPRGLLQRAALAMTATAILPPCVVLFLRPRSEALLYGFAATAWGFFLCSFQVHEKSVLLPLLPMTLLLAQRDGLAPSVRAWVGFANVLGAWTMYPLLKRDGLRVPYAVVTLLWAYLLGLPPTSAALFARQQQQGSNKHHQNLSMAAKVLHAVFYVAMVAWHAVDAVLPPPPTKPDLWVLLNAAIGAAGFGLCYLWCLYQAVMRSGLLEKQQPRKKTR
jgi:alpha-1,3-glucosyltransferase